MIDDQARAQADSGSPGSLQAVERALRLLLLLADSPRPRTLQELAGIMDCSVSTVHRTLTALAEFNFVEKDPLTRRYRLGLEVFHLADTRASQVELGAVARPHMERLCDDYLETVALYVVHGLDTVTVLSIESTQEIRQRVEVGRSIPLAHLGARAKAVLAYLPPNEVDAVLESVEWQRLGRAPGHLREDLAAIRASGVARSFGERVPEAASLAVPIWDHRGLVGSLAIAGPRTRWTASAMDHAEAALRGAATDISRELGHRGQVGRDGRPARQRPAVPAAEGAAGRLPVVAASAPSDPR